MTIRVFLVDDHEMVLRGVADMLERETDIVVVGEASSVRQARARLSAVEADVAILDVRLPDGDGIELCRHIRSEHPAVRCIILTAYDDDQATMAAVLAGASGYVLKDIRGPRLVEDVRAVAGGRTLLHAEATRRVSSAMRDPGPEDPRFGSLGLRERQTLALIGEGMTNRQIAERLGLAEKTVKNYVSSLLDKLGLDSRTQAALVQAEWKQSRPAAPGRIARY